MILVHGQTQTELTAADIEAAKAGGSAYYQEHGSTTYYLIRTPLVPLLMPLKGIVPDPILGAIDPVLRKFIEMGYDRTDYSKPTRAQLFPGVPPLPSFPPQLAELAEPARSCQRPAEHRDGGGRRTGNDEHTRGQQARGQHAGGCADAEGEHAEEEAHDHRQEELRVERLVGQRCAEEVHRRQRPAVGQEGQLVLSYAEIDVLQGSTRTNSAKRRFEREDLHR